MYTWTKNLSGQERHWYKNNSLNLVQKCVRILNPWTLSVPKSKQFSESKAQGNCKLQGTDNVQGKMSEHFLKSNGSYCVYYTCVVFITLEIFFTTNSI